MRRGIQTILAEAGEAACYALSLGKVAENWIRDNRDPAYEQDACQVVLVGIDTGAVYYDEDAPDNNNNFFVQRPADLLEALTGVNWEVFKAAAGYVPQPGEYAIQRWERVRTGAIIGHFRLRGWDPLRASATVRLGAIVSQRICRPARKAATTAPGG